MGESQQEAVTRMTTQTTGSDMDVPLASGVRGAHLLSLITSKSLQDLNDARYWWIPLDALFNAISPDVVDDFFRSSPDMLEKQQTGIAEVVRRVSPLVDECGCKRSCCSGCRIIFAASLFLSKPELVSTLLQAPNQAFCDADLTTLSHCADAADTPSFLAEVLRQTFSPEELKRFLHFASRLRSPYIECLTSQGLTDLGQAIVKFPADVSLPWVYLGDTQETYDEATTVQKMVIHPAHCEPNMLGGYLALKTIFDDHFPDEAQQDFQQEVEANGRAPQHDHIVPVLAAFEHSGIFHLVLPWAYGGNLANLFQRHATSATTKLEGQQVAYWYSENWLLVQCSGLASALAAVHRTANSPHKSAQIHADIKPENILCFPSGRTDCGPFDLKLADLGVAQQVDPETGTIPVKRMPHLKTYRPPEHDTDNTVNCNYDVWCLGCVFLELLTWAIAGSEVLDEFENDRLEEVNEPTATAVGGQVFSDVYFKEATTHSTHNLQPRIKAGHTSKTIHHQDYEDIPRDVFERRHQWSVEPFGNTAVKSVVKTQVKEHIELLTTRSGSNKLNLFLEFIESSMLVIDKRRRTNSEDVYAFLDGLQ